MSHNLINPINQETQNWAYGMKNWLFVAVTALLLILSGEVSAQEGDGDSGNEPIIDNPNDLGVQIFRGVLGDVANIISGGPLPEEPDTVLATVMKVWCAALASVAIFLVGFASFKWFFGSIHSGKLNEQKMDATGVPVRMIIALVSVIPLGAGYCAYQLAHIYISGHSLKVANELSSKAVSAMSVNAFKHASSPINADAVAAQAFETLICAHGINAAEGAETGKAIIEPSHIEEDSEWADAAGDPGEIPTEQLTSVYGIKYGDVSDSWFSIGGYSADACGEYKIEYQKPDFRITTDAQAENDLLNANYLALQDLFDAMSKPASNFVNKVYVEQVEGEPLDQLEEDTKAEIKVLANQYRMKIAEARNQYADDKANEMSRPDSELPNFLKSTPSFLENYSINDIGFIGLGATWWIDSIRTQAFTNILKSMDVHAGPISDKALHHEDLKKMWMYANETTQGRSGRISTGDPGNTENIEKKKEAELELMVAASISIVKETNDPLFALMELGHEMITTAEVMMGMLLTVDVIAEINDNLAAGEGMGIPIIGGILSKAKGVVTGIAEGTAAFMAKGFMLLITLLLTMGVYLAFYLPTIPLMHWLGGVIGAFSAALEQIILAPIHGISHAFTDGQGFVGERAKQGYILAFGSFLRFPMLVISFIVVYPLLLMMGYVTFLLWTPFASSMSSTTVTGVIAFFGLTAALIAVCVSVIERVFSIMHEINDKALRALGHGADSMGAQGFVHSGNQQFNTVQSTVSQVPSGMDKEQGGGSTPSSGSRDKNLAP